MMIGGVTYEATPLTFLEMTQLERLGGSINNLEEHMLTTLRFQDARLLQHHRNQDLTARR